MKRGYSVAAVVVSALFFGTLAIFTPLAYQRGALPLPLLTWRFVLASGLLFALIAVWRPASLKMPVSDIARFAALGLTGYGLASICFFFALKFAPPGVVAVLLYTYPAMVVIAGWVFERQPVKGSQVAAVAVTFAGIVLVVNPFQAGTSVALPGVLLGLGAAVGYTLFNVLSGRWLHGRSRLVMMAWTFGFAAIIAAAAALVIGSPLTPVSWTAEVWLLLAAIVAIPTFGAVVLYLEGIRGLGPAQAALISTLEPIFTIVLAWVLLHEQLGLVQIVGAALVLAGVFLAERTGRPANDMAAV